MLYFVRLKPAVIFFMRFLRFLRYDFYFNTEIKQIGGLDSKAFNKYDST